MNTHFRIAAAIAIATLIGSAVAQDREVEPTEAEIHFMDRLDTQMGKDFGGNDKVEAFVTESDSGERKIHMDYSESEGAEITRD